ncbi:MAG: DUF362 domain-containing protein [Candidatus Latescibacteria bacterium]|nr:DUF362 domain-containing protein [Candidatus Latescibacterota bacterium]
MKQISTGASGLSIGSLFNSHSAGAKNQLSDKSAVSFVTGKDQREASYQALKPLENDILKGIQGKQIVIKVNMGQVKKELWLNATDVNFIRGILDFFKPVYDGKILLAESTAAGAVSTMQGFENFGYQPLLKEYNVSFADLNDRPTIPQWILGENFHPLKINIIDTYLDPNVYLISPTRLKTHDNIFATLSLKNVVMGSPINRYKQKSREGRNEKPLMHSGGNRGLSYNMFLMAAHGVHPDLAVLDGIVAMEGSGPVSGDLIEHGVAIASTDWLAADRLGIEMMGIDYREVKYLQWCADAGMGNDNLSNIEVSGPDYTKHIAHYKLHKNVETQREWIREDYKTE